MSDVEKRFTPEQANAELDELRERLPRLRDARREVIRSSERITDAVAADGGGVAGSDWFEAQRIVRAEVIYLAERGILLRDPETGLVDFPGDVDDRPVFLCWRLGEDDVPRVGQYATENNRPGATLQTSQSGRRPKALLR